jgi:nitrogen fixation/metabolism regulation signal transduction histidine kinase
MSRQTNMQWSIRGKILLITVVAIVIQSTSIYLGLIFSLPLSLTISLSALLSLFVLLFLLKQFYGPIEELISAIETGVSSFKDRDFSIRIHKSRNDELGQVISAYNNMASVLCDERQALFQRELLLDTIIQSTPVSIVLTDSKGVVIYANNMAQNLFSYSKKLEGGYFTLLIERLPPELRDATLNMLGGLINLSTNNERSSFYVHCQSFNLNSREHRLYLYKNLTSEISKQELDLWKNAIRLISHELNNSLAPITSMANSAKKILGSDKNYDILPDLIDTIQTRTERLKDFLIKYADFARLPAPNKERVFLPDFIESLRHICPYNVKHTLPSVEFIFDPAQMEQVLINLYKNALESGSDEQGIELKLDYIDGKLDWQILDQGTGMTEQQLQKALLPFFSTKQEGGGLGLSLCNEIITAHDGYLKIQNRPEKGLVINFSLPRVSEKGL